VVGLSITVLKALEAAKTLEKDGISIEVIDPRTVAPLDIETILQSVKKTGRLLIVDEDYPVCNLGAEVAAQVADKGFDDLDAPIRRLSGKQLQRHIRKCWKLRWCLPRRRLPRQYAP